MGDCRRGVPKEVRGWIRQASRAGWEIVFDGRGHVCCFPPGGGRPVVVACTPSDRRAYLNCRADFRRAGLAL